MCVRAEESLNLIDFKSASSTVEDMCLNSPTGRGADGHRPTGRGADGYSPKVPGSIS